MPYFGCCGVLNFFSYYVNFLYSGTVHAEQANFLDIIDDHFIVMKIIKGFIKSSVPQKVEMEPNCRKPREDENRELSRKRKKIVG